MAAHLPTSPDSLDDRAQSGSGEQLLLLDACGLQCPGPILKVYETVKSMQVGQQLEIAATDFGFAADIKQWCLKTQNTLESVDVSEGK